MGSAMNVTSLDVVERMECSSLVWINAADWLQHPHIVNVAGIVVLSTNRAGPVSHECVEGRISVWIKSGRWRYRHGLIIAVAMDASSVGGGETVN